MEEGTIIFWANINRWIKGLATWHYTIPCASDTYITLKQCIDNKILIEIYHNHNVINKAYTNEVLFIQEKGVCLFTLTWNNKTIRLDIGKTCVTKDNDDSTIKCNLLRNITYKSTIIYNNEEIKSHCIEWINWRKNYLKQSLNSTMSVQIPKSEEEIINELKNRLESLKYLYESVHINGMEFLLNDIYSSLRTMLFWPDNPKKLSTYNPLLFRAASKYDLPLPVYAVKKQRQISMLGKSSVKGMIIQIKDNFANINNKKPGQAIIDIQEWLDSPIYWESEINYYRIKDAIFDYANTYGSHSGTYVPKKIHFFRRIETADKNMGLDLIKNVTEITIATTDYLVNYIDKIIRSDFTLSSR